MISSLSHEALLYLPYLSPRVFPWMILSVLRGASIRMLVSHFDERALMYAKYASDLAAATPEAQAALYPSLCGIILHRLAWLCLNESP